MKLKSFLQYCIAAACLLGMTACVGKQEKGPSSTSGSSQMFCDESFQNIMEQEIEVFEYIYPDAKVLCRYGTEQEAIDSLKTLNYRTIVIPRDLTEAEKQSIKSKNRTPRSSRIAVDAVALIVNPDNPADNLSMTEISEILSGKIKNWNELNPHYPDRDIAVLFDKAGSSMVKYMRDSLLDGRQLADNSFEQGSISAVIEDVRKNKSAIGVIGVSWLTSDLKEFASVDSIATDAADNTKAADMGEINDRMNNSGVKVIGVRRNDNPTAHRPFQEQIYSGEYPLTRSIFMITISPGGSPGGGFYSFVTGNTGQKLIMKTGIMPARMQVNVVELVK